jgi:hypothetical protein
MIVRIDLILFILLILSEESPVMESNLFASREVREVRKVFLDRLHGLCALCGYIDSPTTANP